MVRILTTKDKPLKYLYSDSPLADNVLPNQQWEKQGTLQLATIQSKIPFDTFQELDARLPLESHHLALFSDTPKLPKAVFFDMDSTLVEEESIVELAKEAGTHDEVKRITDEAMNGRLDFSQALEKRVATLEGLSTEVIGQIASRFQLTEEVENILLFLKSKSIPYFLISGGFNSLARPLATRFHFSEFRANELEKKAGRLTGKLVGAYVNENTKEEFVREICQKLGIRPRECAAFGDGANDSKMLSIVGTAVGFRPKKVLLPVLDVYLGRSYAFMTEIWKAHS